MKQSETENKAQQGWSLTSADFASLASARSKMYDFLASFCVKPSALAVRAMLLQPVAAPSGRSVPLSLKNAIQSLRSSSPDFSKEGAELSLQVEWTRLFRGVAKGYSPPPPYESVYKEGVLGGKVSQTVADAYARSGISVSSASTELPDFIGVEFKFMSTLADKEAKAWGSDPEEARLLIEAQRQFAADHVRPWVPRFCEKARKLAETDFYRAVADLLQAVTEWDAALLEGIGETASSAG